MNDATARTTTLKKSVRMIWGLTPNEVFIMQALVKKSPQSAKQLADSLPSTTIRLGDFRSSIYVYVHNVRKCLPAGSLRNKMNFGYYLTDEGREFAIKILNEK